MASGIVEQCVFRTIHIASSDRHENSNFYHNHKDKSIFNSSTDMMVNQTSLNTTLVSFEITPIYLTINIVFVFASLLAIVLNVGILYIIFVDDDFDQDISCIVTKHLSGSDLFCAVFCAVMIIYNVIYNLVHYKIFVECIFRFALGNGIALNSSMIIFAITVDCYVKIISPLKYYTIFTVSRASKAMVVNWLVCVLACLIPVVGWNNQLPHNKCSYFGAFTKTYLTGFAMTILVALFLTIVMYGHIITIAIKERTDILVQNGATVLSKCHRNIWWRPTKTTLIIVGTNIISADVFTPLSQFEPYYCDK